MLRVSNISVDYGATRVVDDFSLQLAADEIVMLVGPTGCGKTTILQAIAGLVPIATGSVALNDWSASPARPVPTEKRNVGMVFQDFALFPHLSVEQNVAFRLDDPAPAQHWLERRPCAGPGRSGCPGARNSGWRWRARWPTGPP